MDANRVRTPGLRKAKRARTTAGIDDVPRSSVAAEHPGCLSLVAIQRLDQAGP